MEWGLKDRHLLYILGVAPTALCKSRTYIITALADCPIRCRSFRANSLRFVAYQLTTRRLRTLNTIVLYYLSNFWSVTPFTPCTPQIEQVIKLAKVYYYYSIEKTQGYYNSASLRSSYLHFHHPSSTPSIVHQRLKANAFQHLPLLYSLYFILYSIPFALYSWTDAAWTISS